MTVAVIIAVFALGVAAGIAVAFLRPGWREAGDWDGWLDQGLGRGWVEGCCSTHDMLPMTSDEEDAFEEGYDPCIPVLRAWGPGGRSGAE